MPAVSNTWDNAVQRDRAAREAARQEARRAALIQALQALDYKDPQMRSHAALALPKMGPAAKDAIPALCAVWAVILAWSGASLGATPAVTTADELTHQALQAEVDGRAEMRTKLLDRAVQTDPSHPAAHWHRGEVQVGHQWMAAADAERRAAGDERLAAYAARRSKTPDTVAGHCDLAAFCRRQGLRDQERLHWTCVWRYEPDHKQAIRALGLKKHGNTWLTSAALKLHEQRELQEAAAKRRWQSVLARLRQSFIKGDADTRSEAAAELQAIRDPAVIPVLEAVWEGVDRTFWSELVQVRHRKESPPSEHEREDEEFQVQVVHVWTAPPRDRRSLGQDAPDRRRSERAVRGR